jgi:hypothetical protein
MDHIAWDLCAGSAVSPQRVASHWDPNLFFLARHSLHRTGGDAFALLWVGALVHLETLSCSRLPFFGLGGGCIFRLSLRSAVWHHFNSLLRPCSPRDFPVACLSQGGHSFFHGDCFHSSDRAYGRRRASGFVCHRQI